MATKVKVTKDLARKIQMAVNVALRGVAATHKLTVLPARCHFDPMGGTIAVHAEFQAAGTVAKVAAEYGLPKGTMGKTFHHAGRRYKVTGFKASRPRFPVVAQRDDGKTFGFPIATVTNRLLMEK